MGISYKDSGVDKEAGYKEVALIKDLITRTHDKNVLSSIGGFSGLYQLDMENLREPVLVSGTDGVGTKLKLAFLTDKHDTIGRDCVAMCVNDILCQGAKPLFFLDYIATGKLVPEKMAEIVSGVVAGCEEGGLALIGGETAEMPGFYSEEEYDLAGFAVGVVDKKKIIDGSKIRQGDVLLGLRSSGLHSNGFSLVRKIVFEKMGFDKDTVVEELKGRLMDELLKPTRIYPKLVYPLLQAFDIHGLVHITGGGLYENMPRIIPEGLCAEMKMSDQERPVIFDLLGKWGGMDKDEMYGTFNMGIGMVLIVSPDEEEQVLKALRKEGEEALVLGRVVEGEEKIKVWL